MAFCATNSSSEPIKVHASDISSIKDFAESNGVSPIPSTYYTLTEPRDDVADELAASIPVIDFSLLTSDDPQIYAKAMQELGKACAEWGFFMVINHGISENLMEDVMKKSQEFHDMPLEEKEFADKGSLTPIRIGTSFHPQAEEVHYWRDYLKVITYPEFNFPHKPPGFKELAFEYSQKIRDVAKNLLQGISDSLGLEPNSIIESSGFDDSGLQVFVVNLYPPCPQPDLAVGFPPHSDHGFLTLLTQNGIGGLQVKHDGKWVNVDPLPKCLIVNIGDQLEAVSNGRYRSVLHRAILNNTDTRISLVLLHGPALDKEIGPATELLEKEEPLFKSMKYRDYYEAQQKTRFANKIGGLDMIRLNA